MNSCSFYIYTYFCIIICQKQFIICILLVQTFSIAFCYKKLRILWRYERQWFLNLTRYFSVSFGEQFFRHHGLVCLCMLISSSIIWLEIIFFYDSFYELNLKAEHRGHQAWRTVVKHFAETNPQNEHFATVIQNVRGKYFKWCSFSILRFSFGFLEIVFVFTETC